MFAEPPSSPALAIKLIIAFRAVNAVTYFNPLLNALLYYIFSKEIRKGVSSLLARCFGRRPKMPKERSGHSAHVLSRYTSKKKNHISIERFSPQMNTSSNLTTKTKICQCKQLIDQNARRTFIYKRKIRPSSLNPD